MFLNVQKYKKLFCSRNVHSKKIFEVFMGTKLGSIRTIPRKKGNTYCVQIRMKGHPHISKTFKKLETAKRWPKDTIYAIENGLPYETTAMRAQTFAGLVDIVEDYSEIELEEPFRSEYLKNENKRSDSRHG